MANFTNIPTGLRVPAQIPLDIKTIALNETVLSNLGDNNNLAFTYYNGLKIYCVEEKTTYIWREVEVGEENTGLLISDFTYPNNIVVNNIDYSLKKYNFFKINETPNLNNVGNGAEIYKEGTTFDLRTLTDSKTGETGFSIITGFTQNTNTIELISKLIDSNSLIITEQSGKITLELPASSTIPGLYVNNLYVPTYEDFLAGNNKGNGSLGKPFTDTITYTSPTTYTITPNTAIQNALDVYVGDTGTYSRLNPQLSGQRIIIQNNLTGYTFNGDFNYSNINILNQSFVNCTLNDLLVNMDNPSYFNPQTSYATIVNDTDCVIQFKKGFLNSGNTINTTTYSTGRILTLKGGIFQEIDSYSGNTTYILNSDPDNNANSTLGCNNDGNLAIQCINTKLYSVFNGLCKIGGKSRIEFLNCELVSNNAGQNVNTNLLTIHQVGGVIRLFDSSLFLGGVSGRTTGIQFSPISSFATDTFFIVRNSRFSGSATTWFNKSTTQNCNFNVNSCNTLYFNGTQLFNSPNLWAVTFNNNIFENVNVDFTKVDFTNNNTTSSSNIIGNNIIEKLVRYSSREIAALYLPKGSAFINTNGSPITAPLSTWRRDIVI